MIVVNKADRALVEKALDDKELREVSSITETGINMEFRFPAHGDALSFMESLDEIGVWYIVV